MRGLFVAVLFLSVAVSWAQPMQGPYTLVLGEPAVSLGNPCLSMRTGDTADVFFQYADVPYHAMVSLSAGGLISDLDSLPVPEGWSRRIEAVTPTVEGWAALVYATTASAQQLLLFQGRNSLNQTSLLAQGTFPTGGQWGNGFRIFGMTLSARPGGGCIAAWQNTWIQWISYPPPGWSEGGSGLELYVAAADWPREPYVGNAFAGGFDETGRTLAHYVSDDSLLILENAFEQIAFTSAARRLGDAFALNPLDYANCAVQTVNGLFTSHGRILLLSRATGTTPSRLVELLDLSSCVERLTFSGNPLAAASHPDVGMAWLTGSATEFYLTRADTTGALHLSTGTVVTVQPGHALGEAALAIGDNGTVAVLWTEHELADESIAQLRFATLGWETPLAAKDPAFILSPSSFTLAAFPNPFNSDLRIDYELPHPGEIELAAYNLLGQQVAVIQTGNRTAGSHSAHWSPELAGGVYFVTLRTAEMTKATKVLYLK